MGEHFTLLNLQQVTFYKNKSIGNQIESVAIRVDLRSWSGHGILFTQLDKYRVFFHTCFVTLLLSSKDSTLDICYCFDALRLS